MDLLITFRSLNISSDSNSINYSLTNPNDFVNSPLLCLCWWTTIRKGECANDEAQLKHHRVHCVGLEHGQAKCCGAPKDWKELSQAHISTSSKELMFFVALCCGCCIIAWATAWRLSQTTNCKQQDKSTCTHNDVAGNVVYPVETVGYSTLKLGAISPGYYASSGKTPTIRHFRAHLTRLNCRSATPFSFCSDATLWRHSNAWRRNQLALIHQVYPLG